MPISEILLLFNSSANFFVFLFFDKGFQLVLKQKLSIFKTCLKTSSSLQPETIPLKPKPRNAQIMNENDEGLNVEEEKELQNGGKTETIVTTNLLTQNGI